MHPAAKSGLHLEPNTCRLGDRRNYSNIDATIDGPYLCGLWLGLNQLHFARAVNLRTHYTQALWRSLTYMQPHSFMPYFRLVSLSALVGSPVHTLFTPLARSRQIKQAT